MINQKQWVLALSIVVLMTYHFLAYFGHYGYDDLHYAKQSAQLLQGIVDYNDHYSYRIPVLFLTSIFYFLFGINDFSSSLPALVMSSGIVAMVYWILKDQEVYTLVIGMALCIFSEWFLFYSDKLMPDMHLAFFQFAALSIVYRYNFLDSRQIYMPHAWSLGLALFLGFLTKESIILLFPVLIYFVIIDLSRKFNFKFWLWSILSFVCLFTLYLLALKYITGELFKRFETIFSNAYLNLCSYDQQSSIILTKRILGDFFQMLISQGMAIGLIIVLAAQLKNIINVGKPQLDSSNFWIVSSLLLALSFNFMTISPTAYSPMCIDPRHYLVLIPVSAVASAPILFQFFKFRKYRIELTSLAFLVCLYSFFNDLNGFSKLYLPVFLLFFIVSLTPPKTNQIFYFILAFTGLLCIKPIDSIAYARKVNYNKQKKYFKELILESQSNCVLITDDVQSRLASYYQSFQESDIELMAFEEFKFDSSDTRKKFVYLNAHTQYLSGFESSEKTFYLKDIHLHNKLIFEDPELNITLYEMDDHSLEEEKITSLLLSKNDFEKAEAYWIQDNADLSRQQAYSPSNSNRIAEYSATFLLPLDSLDLSQAKTIVVDFQLNMLSHEKTDAGLILSVESQEGVYHWESIDPNHFVKAYSNWWTVNKRSEIQANEIKSNSVLKVYVWNPKRQEIYIDDFQIGLGTK